MKSVDVLVAEHELILTFLDQLSTAAERIVNDQGPPQEFFERALEFSREFADTFHHWKEEYVMFSLLAQKHDGAIDAEIERHRKQHEQCRDLIQEIDRSLEGYSRKQDTNARTVHRSIVEYTGTLRSHIRSENDVFFPMVEEALTDEEDRHLLDEFQKYEAKAEEDDPAGKYERIVEELKNSLP